MALSETALARINRKHAAGNKRDILCAENRLSVATVAARVSSLERGLLLFLQVVARWRMEEPP